MRVAGDEEEDCQEDEAGENADGDAGDHDFGAFDAGVRDFFDHVRYGILIGGSVRLMEEWKGVISGSDDGWSVRSL